MVYIPAETQLLAEAGRLGIRCANGLGMLAAQGEEAFFLWTGIKAPPDVMRNILLGELKS
jgi:shikimate dehydrogenase